MGNVFPEFEFQFYWNLSKWEPALPLDNQVFIEEKKVLEKALIVRISTIIGKHY